MKTSELLAAAPWYGWPIGSAVRVDGCTDVLRVVGYQHLRHRRGRQLRLRSVRGLAELTMSTASCVPVLEDNATAALLLARLWEHDTGWHTHDDEPPGYVAHISPAEQWHAPTRGEALALAALACLQNEPPAHR